MSYEFKRDDVYALANVINAETKEKGNELTFKYCPYCFGGNHKDKETFSVNLETGAFKCFRYSCDMQGHFVELARDFNFEIDFGKKKEYKKLEQKTIEIRNEAVEFLKTRGISEEICKKYHITTQKNHKNIIVFPFYDENGVLISAKYRKADFVKGRDKCKEWFEADTKPILFGMLQCSASRVLIITEGQLDCLALAEAGINNSVSVPNGANGFTWIEHCYDWVQKFEQIIVFGDNENGKITLVDEIEKRFPEKTILTVQQKDYLGEKDANDILMKYGKEALKRCILNAQPKPIRAVKKLSDVKKIDIESLEHIKTGLYDVDKVINGLYLGNVYLLTGKRGEGKSTFASQMCVNALEQGYSLFVYSGELPDYHFKNWIDLQIAGSDNIITARNEYGEETYNLKNEVVEKINKWYQDKAFIFDNTVSTEDLMRDDYSDGSLLGTIRKAICRYGIKLVLIDNLMTALDVDISADLYKAQSKFIKSVKVMAQKYNVAVILIAHPKKEQDGKELDNDSVSGSSDITNAVDVVMTYSSNNESDSDIYQSLLGITKNRLTGKRRTGKDRIKLMYSNKSKRIISKNDIKKKVYSCFKENNEKNDVITAPPF